MDMVSNYKKKGMALDKEDRKILRVKRRSVDQRTHRDNTFMQKRDLRPLAPLKENTDVNIQRPTHPQAGKNRQAKPVLVKTDSKTQVAAKPPAPVENTGILARKEMLQKWKKERDLKKLLAKEKEKKKPMFKVCKVTADKRPVNLSTRSTAKNPAPKRNESVCPQPERRVTRASTKALASKPVATRAKPAAPVVMSTRRTTRQSARQATSKIYRKDKSQSSTPTSKPNTEAFHLSPPSTKNVTSNRGQAFHGTDLEQSFAPANFNFHFQFEPLSPASSQKFLFPETSMRKGRCSTPLSTRQRKRAPSPQSLEISSISVIHSPKKSTKLQTPIRKHDVSYFRNLLVTETARLNDLCSKWEKVQEAETLTDEVSGEIRSTIGKAQLLIDQRFKQFSGLVDNCEFGTGEKETNPSDLTGFWEMIYFQVEDVHSMFASLDKLQANSWKKEGPVVVTTVKPKKLIKKKSKPASTVTKPNKDRDAARERLAAIKAAMRSKVTRARASEQVVFEGGFFKVASPARSPAPHCEAGSPFKTTKISTAPGSSTNTPRVQSYTPKNARRSIQEKLCTPMSKLVLGEVVDKSLLNSSRDRMATPRRKSALPAARMATPMEVETALPLQNHSPAVHSRTPRPRGVIPVEQESHTEDPFARYLKVSVVPMMDLKDQPEGAMTITPDLETTPIPSEDHKENNVVTEPLIPLNNTPCTRSRNKSGVLLAGLNSPRVLRTPMAVNQVSISDVFTPPKLQSTINRSPPMQITNDLICFDSPAQVKTGL